IVDSSALTEQVVNDALVSAFDSAGQRCSALRILCLQDAVYDATLTMLEGGLAEFAVGDPMRLATDVGPVIDTEARERLDAHVALMRSRGHRVHALPLPAGCAAGTFVAPTIIEIDRIADIPGEIFGPVLHVLRWHFGQLDALIEAIAATGYGLTMGIHSRITEHIDRVAGRARVGNLYVNRTLIGATVGVQPFGGEGLSGTGPKAGGPFYLARIDGGHGAHRFRSSVIDGVPLAASMAALRAAISGCRGFDGFDAAQHAALDAHCVLCEAVAAGLTTMALPGPTGETNTLVLRARDAVACLADDRVDLVHQLIAAHSVGIRPFAQTILLPRSLHGYVRPWDGRVDALAELDAILIALSAEDRVRTRQACAARPGALVAIIPWDRGTEPVLQSWRLMRELAESVNTAAAGGNASLMTLNEL
ncbi:MAG: aldehyde dehydrogenase family protein, partial [Burkholderiaceae bacterium]